MHGTHSPLRIQAGAEPLPGYRLLQPLGRGGFGEVWKASGPGGFLVALKFVRWDETAGATERRALDVIRDLRHPNLIVTFGAWEVGSFLIVAMELADRTLWDRFREAADSGLEGIPRDEMHEYLAEAA